MANDSVEMNKNAIKYIQEAIESYNRAIEEITRSTAEVDGALVNGNENQRAREIIEKINHEKEELKALIKKFGTLNNNIISEQNRIKQNEQLNSQENEKEETANNNEVINKIETDKYRTTDLL